MPKKSRERSQAGGLVELERDLAEWRRTHGAPSPIPESVWERAAVLGARHGVATIARALRLNHTELKRRTESLPTAEPLTTFIELLPPISGSIAECAMEVESHRGARMRVVMKNVSSACLAGILRDFAG